MNVAVGGEVLAGPLYLRSEAEDLSPASRPTTRG